METENKEAAEVIKNDLFMSFLMWEGWKMRNAQGEFFDVYNIKKEKEGKIK